MNFKHIGAVAVLTVLLPFAASALSVDDLQQQINNLLAQVAKLQEQLKLMQVNPPVACTMEAKVCPDGTSVGRTGPKCEFAACPGETKPVPPVVRICPQILRTLDQGISGSDVKEVQAYLGVSQTGYFGPMTAKAVAAFQADEGLSQVGIVGPQTRAAFARRCGWGNQTFSASPTSGPVPLTVIFRSNIFNDLDSYSINFGDGTSGDLQNNCQLGYGACGLPTATHTYTVNGTYTAKLMQMFSCTAPPGAACAPLPPQEVGTATIQVGGMTSGGAPTVSGIDGPASLAVGQQGKWTVHASVANNANTNLRYSVIWGDEAVFDQIRAFGAAAPTLATSGSFTHAYGSAGTYQPTFTVSNDAGNAQASASVSVGDDPVSSQTFSATPTSGNAPLNVNFSYPYNSSTKGGQYTVNFGDGTSGQMNAYLTAAPCALGSDNCPQGGSWNANHTYASAGTYTAKLYPNAGSCGPTQNCIQVPLSSVTITVGGNSASVTITPDYADTVIHSSSGDPLIQGTASAATSVRIVVTNQSSAIVYDSGLFAVGVGQWSTRMNPVNPIPFGYYTVTAYSSGNQVLATMPLYILGL